MTRERRTDDGTYPDVGEERQKLAERASASQLPEDEPERVLGSVPLSFAKGDRVRIIGGAFYRGSVGKIIEEWTMPKGFLVELRNGAKVSCKPQWLDIVLLHQRTKIDRLTERESPWDDVPLEQALKHDLDVESFTKAMGEPKTGPSGFATPPTCSIHIHAPKWDDHLECWMCSGCEEQLLVGTMDNLYNEEGDFKFLGKTGGVNIGRLRKRIPGLNESMVEEEDQEPWPEDLAAKSYAQALTQLEEATAFLAATSVDDERRLVRLKAGITGIVGACEVVKAAANALRAVVT